MVWGGIYGGNRTRLVVVNGTLTSQRYRDEILSPVVLPYLRTNGPGLTFQQDNATAHTARATREFLNQNNGDMLDWPSNSPDLSPIEHVWDELALEEEWNNIPGHVIQRYVSSMRRRCVAVLNAGGGHTRYWLVKFHSDPRVDQKSVLSPCVSKSDFLQKNIVKHRCLVIITKHCSDPLILNKLTTNYLCYTFLFLFSIFYPPNSLHVHQDYTNR